MGWGATSIFTLKSSNSVNLKQQNLFSTTLGTDLATLGEMRDIWGQGYINRPMVSNWYKGMQTHEYKTHGTKQSYEIQVNFRALCSDSMVRSKFDVSLMHV